MKGLEESEIRRGSHGTHPAYQPCGCDWGVAQAEACRQTGVWRDGPRRGERVEVTAARGASGATPPTPQARTAVPGHRVSCGGWSASGSGFQPRPKLRVSILPARLGRSIPRIAWAGEFGHLPGERTHPSLWRQLALEKPARIRPGGCTAEPPRDAAETPGQGETPGGILHRGVSAWRWLRSLRPLVSAVPAPTRDLGLPQILQPNPCM